MDSGAAAEGWSMIPTHGHSDRRELIISSMSEVASFMESEIEELVQYNPAVFDHGRALQVLGRLNPLQQRLQRMHSSLSDFGRRLPLSPPTSTRGATDRLQQQSAAAHVDTPFADGQMFEEQPSVPFRRAAILTFNRWSRKSMEALQQAGLVKGRGQQGCIYNACLLPFQRLYLEQSRRLCVYHVVAEENRVSDIVAVVTRLPYLNRSRLKKQEVVDLPVIEDGRVHGQQAASSSSAPLASCFSPDRSSSSASRSARSSGSEVVHIPGNVLHSIHGHVGEGQRHVDRVHVRWPSASIDQSRQAGENRDSAGRDSVAWIALGFYSF